MRLLCASNGRLSLTDDLADDCIPRYAILSHTWGQQEVTYKDIRAHRDIHDVDAKLKGVYRKIFFCAGQARRDGLDYFWIDTCCINKRDYTELTEAINSMFRWYRNAEKCYVFLSDVENDSLECDGESEFKQSRWFERGWTLQELLAPCRVEFFSKNGARLGDKASLKHLIHEITDIPLTALSGGDLSKFDVAERFSWAAKRQTKKKEDGAYCLFGIFNVYLPLIYGEGKSNALERLNKAVNARSHDQEERLGKICRWLSAPDPSTNHHKARTQRQAETGLWLLQGAHFTAWKKGKASRLWLYGIPGCGKTILSSTIIEHLQQHCHNNPKMVTVYYYFAFDDTQKQDPELMLSSLLCQLVQRSSMTPKVIDKLFLLCENEKRPPSQHTLLKAISQVIQQFMHVYIVLDALDECKQRRELIDVLETLDEWQLENMHLLMTSRKERDIKDSLESYVKEEDTIYLQRDIVDKDIQRYVQQMLSNNKTLAKWNKDAALRQEIEAALMRGARGMFRWAVCQLETLGQCRNRAMLRKSLATLPETLEKTYERILCAIRKQDSDYAMRILQWLAFSMRPMSVKEIAEAVAIDVSRDPAFDRDEVLEDPLEALNICSSLVTVSTIRSEEEPDPTRCTIALAHYSVQEYLVSNIIQHGPAKRYSLDEAECHGVMMDGCLKYLLQLQQPLLEEVIQTSALARYAAEFWSSHLKRTGADIERHSQSAMCLMSTETPVYLTWLQLYDPDNPWAGWTRDKGLERFATPLYYAALLGLNTITKLLLDQGADSNTRGGRYGNALHAASAAGHHAVVQLLLDNGADVNEQGGLYGNALNAAAAGSFNAIVELLLKNGADASRHDSNSKSVLHHAIDSSGCDLRLIEILLSRGVPADTIDDKNMTPLHSCVKRSYKSVASLLLERGLSVDAGVYRQVTERAQNIVTSFQLPALESKCQISHTLAGLTPLHFAALTGNSTMTKFLLERGADPNALSESNETPIHLALRRTLHGLHYEDDWTCGEWRVESLGDAASEFEEEDIDAIYADIATHREDVLDAILADARTSLTIRDCQHDHPLHCVEYGKRESVGIVKKLVSKGADPFASNLQQQNALHLASRAGDHDAVAVLLSLGVKPTLVDNKGLNALHYAAQSRDHETITVLLGADMATGPSLVASKDTEDRNSLHHLLSRKRKVLHETVQLLLHKGVDGAQLDSSGNSPLACYLDKRPFEVNVDICQTLLFIKGVRLFVDRKGRTLGHLSTSTWRQTCKVLEILGKHGVDLTQKDLDGRTILHSAAIHGSITGELLRYLVNVVGLDINAEDESGKTALQHAAEMASKARSPNTWDRGRWARSLQILSGLDTSQASRAIEH